jgi:hypothetical protein
VVGDVEAGQVVDPPSLPRRIDSLAEPHPTARRVRNAPPAGTALRSGYALPSIRPRRSFLILIVAGFSP